ncbi:ribosomal protein S27AE [Bradyrhizobium japonicum]|nr:ribosomal protein S27AE [Bradyrhizobium japonicum]MCW2344904.1 ribosomal protein S27AE [Bradyrhizobium japonicum]
MVQPQRRSPAIPRITLQRPACPRCKASMMLVSIEPERPGVDLHRYQCAVCNHWLTTLAPYEDPMHSKALGRWLQGDLHPLK